MNLQINLKDLNHHLNSCINISTVYNGTLVVKGLIAKQLQLLASG